MSEARTREFLDRLWILQAEAGLHNAALARRLGCDPSYIRHLKAGRKGRRIGLDIALAATRLFPELHSFLLFADVPMGHDNVPQRTGEDGGTTP